MAAKNNRENEIVDRKANEDTTAAQGDMELALI